MPAFLSDNQYTWTLVITIAVIASLEPETGSEPRSTLRTLAGGSYLPRTTWSSGTWKAGKPALKLTHQGGARAGPESCSRGLRTLGMRGLTLSPAWRTVLGSGCVNRSGGARGQAGCGAGLWIWVWGRELRGLDCSSLDLAGGKGASASTGDSASISFQESFPTWPENWWPVQRLGEKQKGGPLG